MEPIKQLLVLAPLVKIFLLQILLLKKQLKNPLERYHKLIRFPDRTSKLFKSVSFKELLFAEENCKSLKDHGNSKRLIQETNKITQNAS